MIEDPVSTPGAPALAGEFLTNLVANPFLRPLPRSVQFVHPLAQDATVGNPVAIVT